MGSQGISRVTERLVIALIGVTLILTALVLPLLTPRIAHADDSQGLQVSPVIVDLNSEKGGSYNLKLTITNVTTNVLDITSSTNDFTASDETGNPKILTGAEDNDNSYSLKSWVSGIPELTLQPKQSRTLTFAVNVPADAESGGHYGVIQFIGTPPPTQSQTVSLNASVGVLLLARVAGTITEKVVVKDMFGEYNGKRLGITATGPVNIVTRVSNTGNVHVKPIGTLTVKNMFGQTVGSYDFGGTNKNVLPGTTRRYEQTFDKRWMFGRYTAKVEAAYGTTGGVLMGETSFWVIPFKFIFLLFVSLVGLVLLIRFLLKRYNQRIIRKSQHNHKKR
ncbi:MAG: hypothetical protein QG553_717 [Patescibacteria group bacterium]|nr:hypothetical protein [Patescibacteria group bacterium]